MMRKTAALLTLSMAIEMAYGQVPIATPKPSLTAVPEAAPFLVLTGDEAWAAHKKGVLFLDARTRLDFAQGHIPGAINLSLSSPDFEDRLADFLAGPKSKSSVLMPVLMPVPVPVVVYCSGCCSTDALFLALRLKEVGFKEVRHYKDGFPGWARAERPISLDPQP